MRHGIFVIVATASVFFFGVIAKAEETLPYTTRTKSYSGWGGTVLGDISTVGKAGANYGLADSVVSSNDNPAGLAMTFGGVALHASENSIHDSYIQSYDDPIAINHFGASGGFYPWGFGVGERIPYREGKRYEIGPSHQVGTLDVLTREYRFSVARVLPGDNFAVGASLIYGVGTRRLEFEDQRLGINSFTSSAVGVNLGVLAKLTPRVLLGVGYQSAMTYSGNQARDPQVGITDFGESILSPNRFVLGLGWIPNRFFKLGVGALAALPVQNVALLGDDGVAVGKTFTVQPKFGAGYSFIDIRDLSVSIYSGSYYEAQRIENHVDRVHWTGGLEVEPWILDFGWAIDKAQAYRNVIVSGGIDLLRLSRKLKLVNLPTPDHGGICPNPFRESDAGLPRAMVKDWSSQGPEKPEDFIHTAKDAATTLKERLSHPAEPIKDLGKDILDSVENISTDLKKEVIPNKNKE